MRTFPGILALLSEASGYGTAEIILLLLIVGLVLIAGSSALRRIRRAGSGSVRHWLRARLGRGLDVAELARRLDMAESDLRGFAPRYHPAHIPKRRGGTRRAPRRFSAGCCAGC
jgi:hypothetical protein